MRSIVEVDFSSCVKIFQEWEERESSFPATAEFILHPDFSPNNRNITLGDNFQKILREKGCHNKHFIQIKNNRATSWLGFHSVEDQNQTGYIYYFPSTENISNTELEQLVSAKAEDLNLRKIYALVLSNSPANTKLLRMGFEQEGLLRKHFKAFALELDICILARFGNPKPALVRKARPLTPSGRLAASESVFVK